MKIFASQFTEVLTLVDVQNEILWWSYIELENEIKNMKGEKVYSSLCHRDINECYSCTFDTKHLLININIKSCFQYSFINNNFW